MLHDLNPVSRLIVVCLLLNSPVLHACDLCGTFIGILPYDNQNSISLLHRYRVFSGYADAPGQTFPPGAYRFSPAYSSLHGNHGQVHSALDFESYKTIELRGKWFVHPRCELSFAFPYIVNKYRSDDRIYTVSGMGDMSLLAGWHLISRMPDQGFRHRLVAGAGIKFPSGNCNFTQEGERVPLLMQCGTGSTDAIAYLAYTGGGNNFRWGFTASGKFSGTNRYGEQLLPSENATAFGGYILGKGSWKFLPQVQIFQEYLPGMRTGIVTDRSSAMKSMLGGLSLAVYKGSFSTEFSAQLPVYDYCVEDNPENKIRISVSISWNFKGQWYLFKRKNN